MTEQPIVKKHTRTNQNKQCLCNQSSTFWPGTLWIYLCMYLNMIILVFLFWYCRCLQTKGYIYGIGG